MLYKDELAEIREAARREVHRELAYIEQEVARAAGSYNLLLAYQGVTFFAHHPIPGAAIIRSIPHF